MLIQPIIQQDVIEVIQYKFCMPTYIFPHSLANAERNMLKATTISVLSQKFSFIINFKYFNSEFVLCALSYCLCQVKTHDNYIHYKL
jgi:hypothetical protein